MGYGTLVALVNTWRACAGRVTVVAVSVFVKSHLTSGVSVCHENAAMYSVGNEGQNICGVVSEIVPLQRSRLPPLMAIHWVGHFSYTEHTCALFTM